MVKYSPASPDPPSSFAANPFLFRVSPVTGPRNFWHTECSLRFCSLHSLSNRRRSALNSYSGRRILAEPAQHSPFLRNLRNLNQEEMIMASQKKPKPAANKLPQKPGTLSQKSQGKVLRPSKTVSLR